MKRKYNYRKPIKKGIIINGEVCDHITKRFKDIDYAKVLIYKGKLKGYKLERGYYIPRNEKPKVRKYNKQK